MSRSRRSAIALLSCLLPALVAVAACDDSPTAPTDAAVVTFHVVNETFRVNLETSEQVRAAEAALAGGSAKIPNGRIVAGTGVNMGWSWHLETWSSPPPRSRCATASRRTSSRA